MLKRGASGDADLYRKARPWRPKNYGFSGMDSFGFAKVLQVCDVADLEAVSIILPQMFIGSRMSLLPLNPPYPQMCCYAMPIWLYFVTTNFLVITCLSE